MIGPSGNVRVYLACGVTDMRRGIDGLSTLAETVIKEAPGSGAIFGFRGKRADRIKLLWWDGQGFCLFYKVLERGYFPWPTAKDGVAHLTQAQLSMLVEGIDWRRPAWMRIPGITRTGFRSISGQRSDLKPDSIPINYRTVFPS